MKAIQITMDEDLLKRLDADAEVRKEGRSAVLRRAVAQYLRLKRRRQIATAYKKAYASGALEDEWSGWEDQGVWPEP